MKTVAHVLGHLLTGLGVLILPEPALGVDVLGPSPSKGVDERVDELLLPLALAPTMVVCTILADELATEGPRLARALGIDHLLLNLGTPLIHGGRLGIHLVQLLLLLMLNEVVHGGLVQDDGGLQSGLLGSGLSQSLRRQLGLLQDVSPGAEALTILVDVAGEVVKAIQDLRVRAGPVHVHDGAVKGHAILMVTKLMEEAGLGGRATVVLTHLHALRARKHGTIQQSGLGGPLRESAVRGGPTPVEDLLVFVPVSHFYGSQVVIAGGLMLLR